MKKETPMKKLIAATFVSVTLVACGENAAAPRTGGVTPEMTVAKPGDVKPAGWLLDRARAARDGFTGHMDDVDEHFRLAWTTNCMRRGTHLAWADAHKGSWSAEGGAYWFDGLVKLAHQLDDAALKDLARRRMSPVLDNVGPNSVGFVWWYDRNNRVDVDEVFKLALWRIWTAGISTRALGAWWAATDDPRACRAMRNAFSFEELGKRAGGYVPSLLSAAYEAWTITRDPAVARTLDLCCADLARNQYAEPPWPGEEETLALRRPSLLKLVGPGDWSGIGWPRHGVGASEYLLSLLRAYQWTGNAKILETVKAWYAFFDRFCRQPYGVTTMDEEWGWAGVKRGTETCDVAAETFMRENLLAVLGDGKWGDDVERAFFNAGPACVSRDFTRHVYFQLPNRVGAADEGLAMSCQFHDHTLYRRSVWPLCCTAALNRILPNYVQHMWLKTAEGGVAAALYGPSAFAADLPAGRVAFEERTGYPFDETIEIRVKEAPAAAFALKLRIPGWCASPKVAVNGEDVAVAAEKGFATLRRAWKSGDRVTLVFPMKPRFEDFRDMNDYGTWRRSVVMGPLLFAQLIPTDDDNTPTGAVREAVLAKGQTVDAVVVKRGALPSVWNWPANSPLTLELPDADGKPLVLVPYGCTKLRISAFTFR